MNVNLKRVWRSIVIVLLVLLAFIPLGIYRSVESGPYTLHRGETLHGGMFISSPGVVTIEEGARVDGAVFMGSGVLNLDGEIAGGLLSISGEVHTGPNAVVNGHATVTSVPFEPNPGTRFNKNLTADVSGWMGGPIGAALVLLILAFYLEYGPAIWSMIFRRTGSAATTADRAKRRAAILAGGALLVVVGVPVLSREIGAGMGIDQTVFGLIALVAGLALLGVMLMRGPQESPLAAAAAVLVTTGAVCLFQGLTGRWESWAYAWALILPASIGLGRVIEGWWGRDQQQVREGERLAAAGLAGFVAGWVFFELIAPATDNGWLLLGTFLLIVVGLYLLLTRPRRPAKPATVA